ncbi:MAG: ABC transporter [Paucibacter sp.]|nr:ABC transporter [Roseateles sp.]
MKTQRVLLSMSGLGLALCLGACALQSVPPPRLFDLGPMPALSGAGAANPWRVHVHASDDFDTSAMRYRLMYTDPNAVLAYRDSRWSAPPAQLLRSRLDAALAANGGGELQVELLAFEQEFASPDRAVVRLRARASWEQGGVAHGADFDLRVDAAPDAAGFAAAAGPACDRLAAQLAQQLGSDGAKP